MVSPPDADGHPLPPGRPPIRDRRILRFQWLDSVWSCVPCPGGDLGRRLSDSRRGLLRAASGLDCEWVPAAAIPLLRSPDGDRVVESPSAAVPRRLVGGFGHQGLGASPDPKADKAPWARRHV